jgi:opacity protein-like surface antigen
MKIKFLPAIIFAMAFSMILSGSWAGAESYVSGHLGYVYSEDAGTKFDDGFRADIQFDDGVAFSAAVGGRIYDYFRIEQEISYLKQDIEKIKSSEGSDLRVHGDGTVWSLLANVYYDFINSSPVTPYLSAGLGVADIEVSSLRESSTGMRIVTGDDDIVFAYQLGAGIGYQVSPGIVLDMKYRYFATSEPEFGVARSEFASHHFFAGARFFFRP